MPAPVGHNGSILVRCGGGIVLSTLAGTLFAPSPLVALAALALLKLLLARLLRVDRARTTVATEMVVGPL